MASKIVEKWVAVLYHPYRGQPYVESVKVPVVETAKQYGLSVISAYRHYGVWREISDVAKRALQYRRVVPKHEMFDTEIEAIANLVVRYTDTTTAAAARHRAAQEDLAVVVRAYDQVSVNQTQS